MAQGFYWCCHVDKIIEKITLFAKTLASSVLYDPVAEILASCGFAGFYDKQFGYFFSTVSV
jgi:hypothetical protein